MTVTHKIKNKKIMNLDAQNQLCGPVQHFDHHLKKINNFFSSSFSSQQQPPFPSHMNGLWLSVEKSKSKATIHNTMLHHDCTI